MSANSQDTLHMFAHGVDSLRDWPDQSIILDMTTIAERNIDLSFNFASILMSRLTSEQTPGSYKLPFFYLIDSIIKRVGGPFAALFGQGLAKAYVPALRGLDLGQDRAKIDKMFGTWEERAILPIALINEMRHFVRSVPPVVPMAQRQPHQMQQHAPPPPYLGVPQQTQPSAPFAPYAPAPQGSAPLPPVPQPSYARGGASSSGMGGTEVSGVYSDLVKSEMVTMLNQMYAEMNVTNPLSLDELARENPDLYGLIQGKAEDNARATMARRDVTASSSRYPAGASRYGPQSNPQHDMAGKKRSADFGTASHYGPPQQQYRSDGQGREQSREHSREQQSREQQSREQQMREQQSREQQSREQQSRGDPRYSRVDVRGSSPLTNQGQAQYQQQQQHRQQPAPPPKPAPEDLSQHAEVEAKYASELFVNGFVCETPVVVDVNRVASLRDALVLDCESKENGGHLTPVSHGLKNAAQRITKRLTAYIHDVNIPPALPPFLFGLLPLEPIFAFSAAAQMEAAAELRNRAPVHKLPVPPFRADELGRNPEKTVKALYGDRPHQFHEDGIRFRSLAQLKQHTDDHMERKKVFRKHQGERACRDWYCTGAQWISDFNALGVGEGVLVVAETVASAQSGVEEEFVVPADEHFTRCPVSRELFEVNFYADEGGMMYCNAVRVLVTEAADEALYKVAQPWGDDENAPVRYLIVHKLLVLDQWLLSGRAASLRDTLLRYQSVPGGAEKVAALREAEDDDEEDDVFVLLDLSV
mmetsp:Transcript_29458/g.65335  ORF Transcript_29458/g.65335 Transcript_29458/m.65335 type:complete len:759 (+) Transcript_29458:162-2438(+)|eukprot:CAMPEP_0173258486 /NCGR_PEP_ID=MMETSP1142-20121109/24408_1 /TAXON_ID=483371 /ORGANISM="non described non described, Strain CCMP2298" /LENGTH=758 /DNA_ID=CAMNT_0014192843 /DNA_START=117 /DNA_END=2393 /DNA_ORIENTATION=-